VSISQLRSERKAQQLCVFPSMFSMGVICSLTDPFTLLLKGNKLKLDLVRGQLPPSCSLRANISDCSHLLQELFHSKRPRNWLQITPRV
jgi:hypothetical protein